MLTCVGFLKNVMMELRKCCNHPYLFDEAEAEDKTEGDTLTRLMAASGKLALLDRMMHSFRAGVRCHFLTFSRKTFFFWVNLMCT